MRNSDIRTLLAVTTVVGFAVLIGCGGGGGGGPHSGVTAGETAGATAGSTGTTAGETTGTTAGETSGSTSATTGSTSATTGSTSATTGSTAGTTGSTSSTTGSTSSTTGSTSSTTGSTSSTTGSTSSTTGSTSSTTGSTSSTTGSTSSTTGSTGSTTGSTGSTTGSTGGGGGTLTRILQAGDQWVYDVVTSTTTLLGTTVQTALDTQDVVQVSYQGNNRLAIRSRLLKNLAGGGTQLVTTYRVFVQDSVTRTIQIIGYINESGNAVLVNPSTLLPGNITLNGTWNTVSRLLTSVVTTSYNVVSQGNISVTAGLYDGFSFSTSQLALPSLSLDLVYSSNGWVCGPIGNILKETKLSLGVLNTKEIEIELKSTNVD